jgi:hypothetical protein
MRPTTLASIALLTLFGMLPARADEAARGEVQLTAKADRDQPTGWPVLVEVTLTNSGTKAIAWWCGGGGETYPRAEEFAVEVRYGAHGKWHSVAATNGQPVQGSGFGRALKPGESIAVPLAIPVDEKSGGVSFRVSPRQWHAATATEGFVRMHEDPGYADIRRAKVIHSALTRTPAFWRHLAERYADDVVVDAMLKLVTVDSELIVGPAAQVLAHQKTLPAGAGDTFARLITRWLPLEPRRESREVQRWIAQAALKTQGESARNAIIEVMSQTKDAPTREIAVEALRTSPGDAVWLLRAKEAIEALRPLSDHDDLARPQEQAIRWLESGISEQSRPRVPSEQSP